MLNYLTVLAYTRTIIHLSVTVLVYTKTIIHLNVTVLVYTKTIIHLSVGGQYWIFTSPLREPAKYPILATSTSVNNCYILKVEIQSNLP